MSRRLFDVRSSPCDVLRRSRRAVQRTVLIEKRHELRKRLDPRARLIRRPLTEEDRREPSPPRADNIPRRIVAHEPRPLRRHAEQLERPRERLRGGLAPADVHTEDRRVDQLEQAVARELRPPRRRRTTPRRIRNDRSLCPQPLDLTKGVDCSAIESGSREDRTQESVAELREKLTRRASRVAITS